MHACACVYGSCGSTFISKFVFVFFLCVFALVQYAIFVKRVCVREMKIPQFLSKTMII